LISSGAFRAASLSLKFCSISRIRWPSAFQAATVLSR